MNEERPTDLQLLEPEETPEIVKGAMRRFRWRVVLFTVVFVIVAASVAGWVVGEFLGSRRIADMIANAEPAKRAIMEDHVGEYTCDTRTFELDGFEVALLEGVPIPEGGWALHLIVHGEDSLGSGTGRFMNFVPLGPGGHPVQIPAQSGTTWAEAFVLAPSSLGDSFQMELRDLRNDLVGTFAVDTARLACDI